MRPYAWLADFRCPHCAQLLAMYKLGNTSVSHIICKTCGTHSQYPQHRFRHLAALLPAFFGSIALGVSVTRQIPWLSLIRDRGNGPALEPNFLGFLFCIFVFVLPAISLALRWLGIKPQAIPRQNTPNHPPS